jgi:hypothetical protein
MLTVFVYTPDQRFFDETVEFYSLLGFKIVSKFDRSANLHLFSSEEQFSLTVHINDGLEIDVMNKKMAHTADLIAKRNIDHVANGRDFSFGCFEFSVKSPPFAHFKFTIQIVAFRAVEAKERLLLSAPDYLFPGRSRWQPDFHSGSAHPCASRKV